jgi:hypothetical protein
MCMCVPVELPKDGVERFRSRTSSATPLHTPTAQCCRHALHTHAVVIFCTMGKEETIGVRAREMKLQTQQK